MPSESDYPNLHDLANTTMQSTKHELPPSQPDGEISPTNPAKRRRVSAESATNEQKKSRGRPRVEPDDGGSAADRRRTQIRLAQRAYRARAENKKSVLEVKSRKYEGIIDEMHGALARFHTAAVEGGLAVLNPALAHQLHTTLQDFERLAADAKRDDDDVPDAQEKSHSSHDSNSPPKVFDSALGSSIGQMPDPARPIPNSQPTSTESIPSASRPWAYQSSYENLPRPEAQMLPTHIPSHRGSYADPASAGPAEDIHRLHMPANPSSLARPDMLLQSPGSLEILSPLTYSFMETSFSRRLHRAALEKAAYLLSQPKIRDDLLRQMFRVSYRYLPLSEIRDQLQSRIAANSTEPLESFYDFPHNDFGGANTHFKRSGLSGSSIPPLQRTAGPPRPKLLKEEDNPDRPAPDPADDPTGLNGEWFSPDDVQGYLYEIRGLDIGPMAQYVQADFAINSPTLSNRNQANANVFAGEDMSQSVGAYQSVDMRDGTYLASRNQVDQTPHYNLINNVGVARMGGEQQQQQQQQQSSRSPPMVDPLPAPSSRRASRQKVTIDVERLIEELAGTAVCLGRFPGFRRNNVERALQLSIAAS